MKTIFKPPATGHVPHETTVVLPIEEIHKDPLKLLGIDKTFSHFKMFFLV